jgi:transcriptional regulator with XRE-family HTH domain
MIRESHIKYLRAKIGLRGTTQELLSAELGWTRDKLLRTEKGYRKPTRAEAKALAKALGCTVEDLGVDVQPSD